MVNLMDNLNGLTDKLSIKRLTRLLSKAAMEVEKVYGIDLHPGKQFCDVFSACPYTFRVNMI